MSGDGLPQPKIVADAQERALSAGFSLSCDVNVGRMLAVLSATVRPGGLIVELGTGAGVGLAWIVSGLTDHTNVRVVSIELDAALAEATRQFSWPEWVEIVNGDALEFLRSVPNQADLIFADAQGGKTEGLTTTIDALRAGGLLLVDDMSRRPDDAFHESVWPLLLEVRRELESNPRLISVDLPVSTGMILSAKVR